MIISNNNASKVFISYAREDIKTARNLYDDLKKADISPWLDQENLLVGQNWKEGIRLAINESDYFLALLSTRSISKKGFVQNELRTALDILREHPPDKIYILPVRIDNCIPKYETLRELTWADLFPSYEKGLKKILQVLYLEKSDKQMAEILSRFEYKNMERFFKWSIFGHDFPSLPLSPVR